ncbi:MAG: ribosome-associated translation inhibitor RaiA [bacterium]|nr:ribosome-associated translation inhibitor RaiA [bacterium]
MNISITARHIEVTNEVKEYLEKRLNRLKKYFKKEVSIHVVFMAEKERRIIEVDINYNGTILHGEETTNEIHTSIDQVVEKLERQLKKCKDKIQRKSKTVAKTTKKIVPGLTEDIKKIKRKKLTNKPLELADAILQLEKTRSEFLVFIDAQTNKVNVLYQCNDGNYGLIET